MHMNTVNATSPNSNGPALGAIVTLTGAVVGTSRLPDGRTSYLVQFDRKGKTARDWFFAEDVADLGFDD
ncbi:MAG: hypothetical protein EOS36_15500 [Mesorhizobium sp.]|uniref:hypothetical protein n=1 Tax=Mesorhizobium sp. TaxID=1871066 RepID=UPI000FE47234|nr:hypothetical protein [Mesorhizobium sp.]RWD62326.1 MAG: hypothetical protein EOS36_15500 [Mesorhizobium sp.]RWE46919.1 MAG: hypothetical protein EOS79_11115 [Mesorhizobium sp.]